MSTKTLTINTVSNNSTLYPVFTNIDATLANTWAKEWISTNIIDDFYCNECHEDFDCAFNKDYHDEVIHLSKYCESGEHC